jgi:hypothetical protein
MPVNTLKVYEAYNAREPLTKSITIFVEHPSLGEGTVLRVDADKWICCILDYHVMGRIFGSNMTVYVTFRERLSPVMVEYTTITYSVGEGTDRPIFSDERIPLWANPEPNSDMLSLPRPD